MNPLLFVWLVEFCYFYVNVFFILSFFFCLSFIFSPVKHFVNSVATRVTSLRRMRRRIPDDCHLWVQGWWINDTIKSCSCVRLLVKVAALLLLEDLANMIWVKKLLAVTFSYENSLTCENWNHLREDRACKHFVWSHFRKVLASHLPVHASSTMCLNEEFLVHLVSFHEFLDPKLSCSFCLRTQSFAIVLQIYVNSFNCLKSANLLQQSQIQSSLLIIINARAGRKFLCVRWFLKTCTQINTWIYSDTIHTHTHMCKHTQRHTHTNTKSLGVSLDH